MALCPHCQHALPEGPARRCPNCGGDLQRHVPPPPVTTSRPKGPLRSIPGGGSPWEDRERLGLVNALVETTRQVLTQPVSFFRTMPTSGGIGTPLLYAVILGWLGLVASSFYGAVFQSIVGQGFSPLSERPELAPILTLMESWTGFALQVVFGAVFVVVGLFIAAGVFHVMLLLLGGAQRDFEASFRAVSYSQAPSVLLLIPFCGQLIAGVWTLVLYVIGLAEAHRTGYGKATAAVLLPMALLCCCCVGIAFFFASAIAGLVGHLR